MDIATFHFVETLKEVIPSLRAEVAALRDRVEELEAEAARRKGGRPRKVEDVQPMGEAN